VILDKEIPGLCQASGTWWSPAAGPSCAKKDQKSVQQAGHAGDHLLEEGGSRRNRERSGGEQHTKLYSDVSNRCGSARVKLSTTRASDRNGEGWSVLLGARVAVYGECPNSASIGWLWEDYS